MHVVVFASQGLSVPTSYCLTVGRLDQPVCMNPWHIRLKSELQFRRALDCLPGVGPGEYVDGLNCTVNSQLEALSGYFESIWVWSQVEVKEVRQHGEVWISEWL